jgi:hypothetical protein
MKLANTMRARLDTFCASDTDVTDGEDGEADIKALRWL